MKYYSNWKGFEGWGRNADEAKKNLLDKVSEEVKKELLTYVLETSTVDSLGFSVEITLKGRKI